MTDVLRGKMILSLDQLRPHFSHKHTVRSSVFLNNADVYCVELSFRKVFLSGYTTSIKSNKAKTTVHGWNTVKFILQWSGPARWSHQGFGKSVYPPESDLSSSYSLIYVCSDQKSALISRKQRETEISRLDTAFVHESSMFCLVLEQPKNKNNNNWCHIRYRSEKKDGKKFGKPLKLISNFKAKWTHFRNHKF